MYVKMFEIGRGNENMITALALLIEESDSKAKDLMIKLIIHILV